MDQTRVEPVRNVAIVSHVGAGKTSLSEALLYCSAAIPVLGSVAHGTTVSDFEPEELHHRSSTSSSLLQFTWNHTRINLIDTPGALTLLGEPLAALRAVDAVVLVLTGQAGVRTELATLWGRIKDLDLPCLVFVNGLDREGSSFESAMDTCHHRLECTPVPLVVPVQSGAGLEAVVDLLQEKVIQSGPASWKIEQAPIPSGLEEQVREARKQLIEAVAESDENLLEKYVAQGDLSAGELMEGLRAGLLNRHFLPVYAGSATRTTGVWSLLNGIASLAPSAEERASTHPPTGTHPDRGDVCERRGTVQEPFSAYVFKTLIDPFVGRLSYGRILSGTMHTDTTVVNTVRHVREKVGHVYTVLGKKHTAVSTAQAGDIVAFAKLKDTQAGDTLCQDDPICYPALQLPRPVLSFAIEAKSKGEIDKVSLGLHKLIEEDPTLEFVRNSDTKEMVLSGLGQQHIDLALEKLHRKFGAHVTLHTPKIPYRETVKTVSQAQGKYKKQTGGHGQYGDCWLEVAPLPRGEGFVFESRVVGGAIPRTFIPAIEKGVIDAMQEGVVCGFPVVDVRVAVFEGSYHVVDSSEMSFKIAGSMAFKKAMEQAHPVLLEPAMMVEIDTPTETVGAVMGDLNSRRGRIVSVNANDHAEQIKALVPLAELLTYAPVLHALTGGRGNYVMDFARYEEVPRDMAGRIVEHYKADRLAMVH
jgi:elongation factor G